MIRLTGGSWESFSTECPSHVLQIQKVQEDIKHDQNPVISLMFIMDNNLFAGCKSSVPNHVIRYSSNGVNLVFGCIWYQYRCDFNGSNFASCLFAGTPKKHPNQLLDPQEQYCLLSWDTTAGPIWDRHPLMDLRKL
jgi:hypothetical protein